MLLHSPTQLDYVPRRIVSLVPSQTALLYHLQLEERVVGITKFCVHPPHWKKSKTIVGGTKNIHLETVKKLAPHLVIANKEENVKEQVDALAAVYNVWVTDVHDLQSAIHMIAETGEYTHSPQEAAAIITGITNGFAGIQPIYPKINSCYLIWRHPYMTIGGDTFIHDIMERCGLRNIYGNSSRYPEISLHQLRQANCELLLLSSEPYPFQQQHIDELQQQLPGTKILLVDGEIFSWYGSRLLQAPAYLNALLKRI
jgi:ABC-type Fe3+-hydroxamate transport system substrate-binding protein